MQALLDHEDRGAAYRIELLIVDRPCAAEQRARARGRAVHRVDFARPGGAAGAEILELLKHHGTRGVLLAGFLKLLPADVCREYEGRILNIHPALLPSFGGKGMHGTRVHEAVLRSGASLSGPTIHFVNQRYDEGMILAQWPVPVVPGDTPATLAARVLRVEHLLYPAAADALARALAAGNAPPSFRWPGPESTDDEAEQGEMITKAFGGAGE
jgi:folate-dependent phosphoribosylglycinamide formyltransferase PurN